MKMRDVPDLLHHITTMFSPRLLQQSEVPIYKLLQQPGEYVVTFPRAFHGGFSMGPNIGEAVNFATHDWIAYGCDANERYRSFARPAVFSHDRLTFTMAHHVEEEKSYKNCALLLNELERIVEEELKLRKKLVDSGVRDVSEQIELPKNCLEQLDEDSAEYDDKRLCHACKHVCFFSAVACVCSQSNVSCLRHSHYMCRCPVERRYLMIWSSEKELNSTIQRVRDHCRCLKETKNREEITPSTLHIPSVALGAQQDQEEHREGSINVEPCGGNEKLFLKTDGGSFPFQPVSSSDSVLTAREVTSDEERGEGVPAFDTDDEVEVVGVRDAKSSSY